MLTTPVCLHISTGCRPQPPTIPQSNKVGSCGSRENHNSKAWEPHTVPTAFSYKQMTSSPVASAENTTNDWKLAGPGTRERKEMLAMAERESWHPNLTPAPSGWLGPWSALRPPPAQGTWPHANGTALMCYIESKTKGTIHHIFQQVVSFLSLEEKLGNHKAKFFKNFYIFSS